MSRLPGARPIAPGASIRSGHGSSPARARPRTTRTKPAILTLASGSTQPPRAAAPAPSTTNTTVNPIAKGTLADTIRLATPRSPSRSTSTDEIAER